MHRWRTVLIASLVAGLVSGIVYVAGLFLFWAWTLPDVRLSILLEDSGDYALAGALGAAFGVVVGGGIAAVCTRLKSGRVAAVVVSGILAALTYGVASAVAYMVYCVGAGYGGPNGLGIAIVLAAMIGIASAVFGGVLGAVDAAFVVPRARL